MTKIKCVLVLPKMAVEPGDRPECLDLTKPGDRPECPDLTKPDDSPECPDLAKIAINIQFIVDEVEAADLLNYFIQEGVLSDDDSDLVRNAIPNTRINRNLAFLNLLINSEPRAYGVFIESLTRSKSTHVVDTIQNTVVESHGADIGKLLA
jgi:hypothetical protein